MSNNFSAVHATKTRQSCVLLRPSSITEMQLVLSTVHLYGHSTVLTPPCPPCTLPLCCICAALIHRAVKLGALLCCRRMPEAVLSMLTSALPWSHPGLPTRRVMAPLVVMQSGRAHALETPLAPSPTRRWCVGLDVSHEQMHEYHLVQTWGVATYGNNSWLAIYFGEYIPCSLECGDRGPFANVY